MASSCNENVMEKDLLALIMNRTIFEGVPHVSYLPNYYDAEKSNTLFNFLKTLAFEPIQVSHGGQKYMPSICEFTLADPEIHPLIEMSHPWPIGLLEMKMSLEKYLDIEFNCAVLTYYANGYCSKDFGRLDTALPTAILSFGANRVMEFNQTRKVPYRLNLESGCLLVNHDIQWECEVPISIHVSEPTIMLTFKNIIIQEVSAIPLENTEFIELNTQPSELKQSTPIVLPQKQNFQEWVQDQSQIFDIGFDVCGNMVSSQLENIDEGPSLKTLKQFYFDDQLYISVELYKGELQVQIAEIFGRWDVCSGLSLNLLTFYELGRKIANIDPSLHYSSDSGVINNCILIIVKHDTLLLKQFNEFQLMRDEIRINSQQLKKFKEGLCQMEECIIEYVFTEQLKSAICTDIPYTPSMDSAFQHLKKLVHQDLRTTFCVLYPTWKKDKKEKIIPNTLKMLCRIYSIQEEFLTKHSLLAHDAFDFKQLSMEIIKIMNSPKRFSPMQSNKKLA